MNVCVIVASSYCSERFSSVISCSVVLTQIKYFFSFLTALKMAAGGGLGTGGGNPFWSFVWFLGLLFVGYPVAGFCAGWYILILPFGVCFDGFSVRK